MDSNAQLNIKQNAVDINPRTKPGHTKETQGARRGYGGYAFANRYVLSFFLKEATDAALCTS